jgi:hypothetical protein
VHYESKGDTIFQECRWKVVKIVSEAITTHSRAKLKKKDIQENSTHLEEDIKRELPLVRH